MPHIFMLPVATNRIHSTAWDSLPASHKRKKQKLREEEATKDDELDNGVVAKKHATDDLGYPDRFTADEMLQRYLAGHVLDQEPTGLRHPRGHHTLTKTETMRGPKTPQEPQTMQSLHMQHLAALTTIVHRSVLEGDLPRASRALGLLFREDLVSEHAEVRTQGLMGIAAEVLLRHGHPRDLNSGLPDVSLPFTHGGFEKAKRLYERLVVRHPHHKSWPNAVNAIDFYLAMFNLWIYVVHSEHTMPAAGDEDRDAVAETSQQVRELEQATQIAKRLDACMASVPYMDEPEFIRLSAMVASWVADLHETCAVVARRRDPEASNGASERDGSLRTLDQGQDIVESEHILEANRARAKAQELLSKLEDQGQSHAGVDTADSDSDG